MNGLFDFILSFACATLSALGMGGGGILLIYLTAFGGVNQLQAQGINLIYFIPVSLVAIFLHSRKKLIRWRFTWRSVILGIAGVYLGWKLAMVLESEALSKLFGLFLLFFGLRELFGKEKNHK